MRVKKANHVTSFFLTDKRSLPIKINFDLRA
jgi:hypothetical protein